MRELAKGANTERVAIGWGDSKSCVLLDKGPLLQVNHVWMVKKARLKALTLCGDWPEFLRKPWPGNYPGG